MLSASRLMIESINPLVNFELVTPHIKVQAFALQIQFFSRNYITNVVILTLQLTTLIFCLTFIVMVNFSYYYVEKDLYKYGITIY